MSPCWGRSSSMTARCRGFWSTRSCTTILPPPAPCARPEFANAIRRCAGSSPPKVRPTLRLRSVCRDGRCDEFAEGDIPMQFDAGHLTAQGSLEVARRLSASFRREAGGDERCFELNPFVRRRSPGRLQQAGDCCSRLLPLGASSAAHGEARTALARRFESRQIRRRVRQLGPGRPRASRCRPGKNG